MTYRTVLERAGLGFLVCLAIFTLNTFAVAPAPQADAAAMPLIPPAPPKVIGPVRNTTLLKDPSHGYPFNATPVDFKKAGYVEEEYFIEGKANRFITSPAATATPVDGGNPYLTRLVVRRPASAAKFNGTVLVEWTNVSQGHDHEADWFQVADHIIRSGYAWVGVSAQSVGVQALTQWSPSRYGALNVIAPAPRATETVLPQGQTRGGAAASARGGTPSPLSFDIFTQAGLVVRGKSNINVMGGLKVERLIATGHSQSAGQLGIYFNSVHPLAKVYDAVVLHGGGGKMRTDLTVKVFKILAETDLYTVVAEAANRQPDTETFRSWEVAGASHLDAQNSRALASVGLLVAGATPVDGPDSVKPPTISGGGAGVGTFNTLSGIPNDGCAKPPFARIPFRYVLAAVYDHTDEWVKTGKAPPLAVPIELMNNAIVRDADGNARGGIQLSQHSVPTGVNRGDNTQVPGATAGQFCNLLGSYVPFTEARLDTLYPRHDAYVKAVKEATDRNLKAGFILKADAEATIEEAGKSKYGKK